MRNWMKQLNRVIVLALMLVCLFGCISMEANAWPTYPKSSGYWWNTWEFWFNNGTSNTDDDTRAYNCWIQDGSKYFFIGSNGLGVTGWHHIQKEGSSSYYWHHFNADGVMQTGWFSLNGVWHYADSSGYANTTAGTRKIGDNYYYFNSDTHNSQSTSAGWKDNRYYPGGGGSGNCAYRNRWTPDGHWVGNDGLKVTRTWTVKNAVTGQTGKAFSITVKYTRNGSTTTETISLANGGSKTYTLPYNTTFTVSQGGVTGYSTSITNASGTLTANTTTTVTNTAQFQTLTVTNTVKGTNVTCSYTVTSKYADGGAHATQTFTLANGGSKALSLPKGGAYTVTQAAVSGYRTDPSNRTRSGTLSANATAAFTNIQQLTLKVTNTVVGADKAFGYTVVIGSKTYTGISLGNGKSWTSPDAYDYDTSYSVTQTSDAGYTTSSSKASGKLAAGVTAAFTNTQKKYNLTLSNTIVGEDAGITYSVTIGTEDKGTFTLTHGGTQVFENIPHGTTYSITRTDDLGYLTDDGITRSGTLTQATTVTYVNRQLVRLTVTNTVVGADKTFTYNVVINGKAQPEFTLSNGGSWTSEEFPHGVQYSVTQKDDPGYTKTSSNETGTMAAGMTAAFTNTHRMLNLTVTNQVAGEFAQTERSFTITISVSGREPVEVSLVHGESFTIEGIPYGTAYSVTEEDYSEFGYSTSGVVTDEALTDDTMAVTVTNTLETKKLTVVKAVNGTEEAKKAVFVFTLSASYADGTPIFEDEEFSLTDSEFKDFALPKNATYTVTEEVAEGFGFVTEVADTGNGKMENDSIVTSTSSQMLKLVVSQVVEGAFAQTTKEFIIKVSYTKPGEAEATTEEIGLVSGGSEELTLPYGTRYSVTEDAYSGYETSGEVTDETLTEQAGVTIINEQLVSKLIVANVVNGTDAAKEADFNYTVSVTYADGAEFVLSDADEEFTLNNGASREITLPRNATYVVEQAGPEGYRFGTTEKDTGSGTATGETTVTFTNTQLLTVTVTNKIEGANGSFRYQVAIDGEILSEFFLENGGTWTNSNAYPYDAEYTVTQTAPEGFRYHATVVDSHSGKLTGNATVAFTNVQMLTLTVTNEVVGTDAPFTYRVQIGDDLSEFSLKNGETWTSTDWYRYDSEYTVGQNEPEGLKYTTVVTGSENAALSECTAVSYKNTQLLPLTIINNVVGADNTIKYSITIGDQITDLELANNTSGVVDVPYGSNYTIAQTLPEGYNFTVVTDGDINFTDGMTTEKTVTYNNTQMVTLTLKAEIDGNMASKEQEFTFDVKLGEEAAQTDVLKGGETWEFEVPYGTAYTITQDDYSQEGYETKINNGGVETEGVYIATGTVESDIVVVYTNHKGFAIPTAVSLTVLPFLGMVLFGGGIGITQLLGGRKSRRGRYLN